MKLEKLTTAVIIVALLLLTAGAVRAATYTLVHDYGENGDHPSVCGSSCDGNYNLDFGVDYSGIAQGVIVDYVSISVDENDSNPFPFYDNFDLRSFVDLGRLTLKIRHRDNDDNNASTCYGGERWHYAADARVYGNTYNRADDCADTDVEWLSESGGDIGWFVDTYFIDPRDVQTYPYFRVLVQEETRSLFPYGDPESPFADDADEIKIDYISLSFQARPAAVVPLPGAAWLLGTGLLGLCGLRRFGRRS